MIRVMYWVIGKVSVYGLGSWFRAYGTWLGYVRVMIMIRMMVVIRVMVGVMVRIMMVRAE